MISDQIDRQQELRTLRSNAIHIISLVAMIYHHVSSNYKLKKKERMKETQWKQMTKCLNLDSWINNNWYPTTASANLQYAVGCFFFSSILRSKKKPNYNSKRRTTLEYILLMMLMVFVNKSSANIYRHIFLCSILW